jgi:acyl-CoA thioester hydrolase
VEALNASPHQSRLRVRYAETDQMGVVHHANYLVWMEVGRVELIRARGCNYKDLEREGLFLSVVGASCRYIYPAKYDEEIIVETQIVAANHRVVEFGYEIRSDEGGKLLAEGATKHVWLNREWRPTRLPEHYQYLMRIG